MSGAPDVRWRGVGLCAAVVVLWCMYAVWLTAVLIRVLWRNP